MIYPEQIEELLSAAEAIHSLNTNPGLRQTFNYGNLLIGIVPNADTVGFKDTQDHSAILDMMASDKLNPSAHQFLESLGFVLNSGESYDAGVYDNEGNIVVTLPLIKIYIDVITTEAELVAQAIKEASAFDHPEEIKYITSTGETITARISNNDTGKLNKENSVVEDEDLGDLIRELDFHISDQFDERTIEVTYRKDGLTTLIDCYEINVTVS